MSITPVAKQPHNYFDNMPDDAIISVFEFLKGEKGSLSINGDDRAVLATFKVCHSWQDDSVLKEERRESFTRLQQRTNQQNVHNELIARIYPQQMIQLFRRCHLPIARLPVLELSEEQANRDYISVRSEDMTHPIMRFKDSWNRPGIAFHLEGYAERQVEYRDHTMQIRDISGAMTVFKRFTNSNDWRVGVSRMLDDTMFKALNDRHNETDHVGDPVHYCPTCPRGLYQADAMNYLTLSNFLEGHNPLFRIAQGYIPPHGI